MDPNGLTMEQVRERLRAEDPTRYRHVMQDLQYEGDEPSWQKRDFFEKYIRSSARPGQSEEDKAWEDIQRHKKSRDLLSVKLEKA